MPEAQETLKEATTPMVDLDTTGNSVDVELDDSKANTKEVETKKEEAQLPQPTGWRLLILPHKGKNKTKGGVYLTGKTVEETQIAANVGLVLKVGPDAYNDRDRFPNGAWCKEKDWVIFAR